MQPNIKWGILGAGKIAARFATAINHTPGAALYAVASRDAANAAAFAATHGAQKQYTRYEDLAGDPAVDIVYIATPHVFHCEHALLCIGHGKAVLCEKPMAVNHAQATHMALAARQQKVFLMEGMWTRFMPSLNKAKELADAGAIGEIRYITANFGFNAPYLPEGRLYNRQLGGGSLLDVGVYPLFLAGFFLGAPASVTAVAGKAPTGADTYCHMLFEYTGGVSAHLFSAIHVDTSLEAVVYGTNGRLVLPAPWYKAEQLRLEKTDGSSTRFDFPHRCNGFEYEVQAVMECLRDGLTECPAMPLDFSLQISKIVDEVGTKAGIQY